MPNKDPFDLIYRSQGVNDLIVSVNKVADKAETHQAFQCPVSEYVSLPPRLREIATNLGNARDKGDSEQLALSVTEAVQALDNNADHVCKFSVYRNDTTLLHNAGYDFKQQSTGKAKVNLLDLEPELILKHLEGVTGRNHP